MLLNSRKRRQGIWFSILKILSKAIHALSFKKKTKKNLAQNLITCLSYFLTRQPVDLFCLPPGTVHNGKGYSALKVNQYISCHLIGLCSTDNGSLQNATDKRSRRKIEVIPRTEQRSAFGKPGQHCRWKGARLIF